MDPTTYEGLFWPAEKKFMRQYALEFAAAHDIKLEEVNRRSAESHRRAKEAAEKGLFQEEVVSCGEVDKDDLVQEERPDRELEENPDDIASLLNSSTPADAAAALVLTTKPHAERLGVKPMARVLAYACLDGPPADYLSAPVRAAELLFRELEAASRLAGFTIAEANEAFGIQLPLFHDASPGVEINVHGYALAPERAVP